MSTLDDLKGRFFKFRRHKFAIYIGLAISFLVCTLLLIYANSLLCFGYLLVALAGFYIPYYFGLKSRKKLAVWGIVLIVMLALPYTALIVNDQKGSANVELSTSDGAMVHGTVSPFTGDASTNHTFSILVTNSSYSQVNVIVVDVWSGMTIYNRSMSSTNVSDGRLFTFYADPASNTGLNNSEFGYWFVAFNGEKWVATSGSNYGPIHVSDTDLFVHWLPYLLLVIFVYVGVLYFLLLALNYWSEKSKARMVEMQKQYASKEGKLPPGTDKEEKFVCSECGADVPANADRCPQCGERFDEDKKEEKGQPVKDKGKDEYFCTDCGAKVDADAKKCWNCGKEFEN